jgi:hypothetical protein
VRAPTDTIIAPLFPSGATWLNGPAQSPISRGRPMLLEFFDYALPNSMRTLPYMVAWHERYGEAGLRVVSVHSPGGALPAHEAPVAAAVERLGISHPVMLDHDLALWNEYENEGWPVRYLFDGHGRLFEYHYGEGGYAETEQAIQELLGIAREPLGPLRPQDAPDALLAAPSEMREGAYSGPYRAGGVWAILDGVGTVRVNGREVSIPGPGAYELVRHENDTAATLDLVAGAGVLCIATCFAPGLAQPTA